MSSNTTDEDRLWATFWRTHSDAARTALFHHYEPLLKMVRGRAFSGVDGSHSCTPEDLYTYAATGLLHAIDRWTPERGEFRTYANACIEGKCLHGLADMGITPKALAKRGEKWTTTPLDEPDEDGVSLSDVLIHETAHLLAEGADRVEREEVAEKKIRRLPWRQKAAFRGLAEQGRTPAEVGEQLGISAGEVRREYRAAQAFLYRRLKPQVGRLLTSDNDTDRPTNINRSVRARFRVDRATIRAVDRLATEYKTTRAWVVRDLIEEAVGA